MWAGGAHELQLRACARAVARDLRVHFVAVGASAQARGRPRDREGRGQERAGRAGIAAADRPARAAGAATRSSRAAAPSYGEVQVAFVHHTVSANDYTPEQSAGDRAVDRQVPPGHATAGTTSATTSSSTSTARSSRAARAAIDQAVIGAQAQGYNRQSTGISNIGTYTDVPQTTTALEVVARLIGWKLSLHSAPVEGTVEVVSGGGDLNRYPNGKRVSLNRISGHRDGDQTACPGNALYAPAPGHPLRAAKYATAVATGERLTMVALAARVSYGDPLTVKGTFVGADGLPVGDTRVNVQKRGESGSWTTVASATTAADGEWQVSVPWRRAGALRARGRAPGAVASAVSATASVDIVPVLEAKALTRRVNAGSRVAVSGTLHPDGVVRVRVERQLAGGRWVRGKDVVLRTRGGVFRGRVLLGRPGLYRLTPRAGVAARPVAAPALFVRAVRPKRRGAGGAQAPGGPTGGTGGAAA